MMQKLLLLFCFSLMFNFCHAQSADESAIRAKMKEQVNAWNRGDINAFMQTYWQSDSLVFIGSKTTYGWKATLESYKQHYVDTVAMGKLSFKLLQLRPLSAEYYFVIGEWHLKRTAGDVGGSFTLLFRKIKGNWLIVVDHSS